MQGGPKTRLARRAGSHDLSLVNASIHDSSACYILRLALFRFSSISYQLHHALIRSRASSIVWGRPRETCKGWFEWCLEVRDPDF